MSHVAVTQADVACELLARIRNRSAVVGVIGLGYVGLPFAVEKAKAGYRVVGVDRNEIRAGKINQGQNYISDVCPEELRQVVASGTLSATGDFSRIEEMDVVVVAVPTPLSADLTPDLQYVKDVTYEIARRLRPGQLISLESTTYPGTTEEVMLPILESSGLEVEKDFFLAHSPERVDPGNPKFRTKNTTKVVGGLGPHSLRIAHEFYSQTLDSVVPVSSARAAELTKIFENTFRAVNIALVNEITMLCDKMGLNAWEVLDAAFTKPFGIMPFYPGPGVGGHCIPIDPHYLEWKAKELGFDTHFIALAGEINRKMPSFVFEKAERLLRAEGKSLAGSKITLLGAAYKRDIDDWREAPALEIIRLLEEAGADVQYHDPHVSSIRIDSRVLASVPLDANALMDADLVLIVTDHSAFDYERIVELSPLILDTRNATKHVRDGRDRIALL